MKLFLLNILLAFIWIAITGRFTVNNFFFGFISAYFFLWIAFRNRKTGYFEKVPKLIKLMFFLLREIIRANFRVTYQILTPKHRMRPGILSVPIRSRREVELTLLSIIITLTPGSLALDISGDQKSLYIHFINIDDPEKIKRSVGDLEKRILAVLR